MLVEDRNVGLARYAGEAAFGNQCRRGPGVIGAGLAMSAV